MNNSLPIYTSAFSLRSIYQIKSSNGNLAAPASIYDSAKKHNLQKVFLLEQNFTSFLESVKILGKEFQLVYGIRFTASYGEYDFKINIFATNTAGTKDLQKLYTRYSVDFDSKIPIEEIQKAVDASDGLHICIPYFDSHIHKNLLGGKIFVDFGGKNKPTVFLESGTGVMFDGPLREKVEEYARANNLETQEVRSVYYENRADFQAFQTYRCVMARSKIDKPELQFMSSDEFCMESWAEQQNQ